MLVEPENVDVATPQWAHSQGREIRDRHPEVWSP